MMLGLESYSCGTLRSQHNQELFGSYIQNFVWTEILGVSLIVSFPVIVFLLR